MCQVSTSRSGPKPVESHLSQGLGLLVAAVDPSLGVLQPRPEALLGPDFEKELEIKGSFWFRFYQGCDNLNRSRKKVFATSLNPKTLEVKFVWNPESNSDRRIEKAIKNSWSIAKDVLVRAYLYKTYKLDQIRSRSSYWYLRKTFFTRGYLCLTQPGYLGHSPTQPWLVERT